MTPGTDSDGLTPTDIETLRDIAENGVYDYAHHSSEPDPDTTLVECHHCDYQWNYTGTRRRATCPQCGKNTPSGISISEDARGLSVRMCNAIRAAAEDDKTYREITELFSFVRYPRTANEHATGRCSHGAGDYPPVPPERDPGPTNPVTREECEAIRDAYDDSTIVEIVDATGRSKSTVWRHATHECTHGDTTPQNP